MARSRHVEGGRGVVVRRTGGPFVTVGVLPTSTSTLRFPARIGRLSADRTPASRTPASRTPASHTPGRAS